MNVDTGLVRMLPPMPPENQKQEDIKVKERNLFLVLISGSGNIMAGPSGKQEIIDLRQLKDKTKEFILNPMDDENRKGNRVGRRQQVGISRKPGRCFVTDHP